MTILQLIQGYCERTGHHNGLTVVEIMKRSEKPLSEVKAQLNELYDDGEIDVRKGVHGRLIFTKN